MLKKLIPFLIAALLLTLAIAWSYYNSRSFSDESIAEQIGKNLDQELLAIEKEALKISTDSSNLNWSSLYYSFYLIDRGRIISWSKNSSAIDVSELESDFNLKLLQTARADVLLYRFSHGDRSLVAVLPLRSGYEIVNQYLTTRWNDRVFPVQGVKIFPVNDRLGSRVCRAKQECLFKIQLPEGTFLENRISLGIILLALAFAIFGIYRIVLDQHRKRNYFTAFLILSGSLAAIRIVMVQFQFPGGWLYSKFFDPKYFASSSFNASMGDFFLNALVVAIASAYLFRTYSRSGFVRSSNKRSNQVKWIISLLLFTFSYFSFLFPHLFVESVFHDSAISIDIKSGVDFDGLRVLAFSALVLGCMSSFFVVHILIRWLKLLIKPSGGLVLCFSTGSLLFIGYFLFSELNYWPTFLIGAILFLLLYFSNYFRSLATVGYQTFSFLLIAVIAYGLQGAFGIWRFAEEKQVRSMVRSASNLINRDVLGEYLLNETAKKIAGDKFIVSEMTRPLSLKGLVRHTVKQVHLNSYFDRYEVRVNLYHSDSSSVDRESENFATTRSFENESSKTNYEGIYFIRNTASENVKRYLTVVPIKNKSLVGYIVLDLSSKQIVPQQVYPELLVDNRFSQSLRDKNYSYAFFRREKLASSIGSYNFNREFNNGLLSNSELYSKGIKVKGNWLVGAEDETGKQAIVAAEIYPVFFFVANFSFLSAIGVSLIFFALTIYLITRWRLRYELAYSARIQLYICLSFILPLVVVSSIALRMISQSEEEQLEKEIKEKGLRIAESMSDYLHNKASIDSLGVSSELKMKLGEASQSTFADANLYTPSGLLITSSQPTIFNSRLVMPLADRASWEKIVKERYNIVQARCHIGLLAYNSLFFVVKPATENGLIGILELPFFQSNAESAKVSVLANILVTFVIVFILFSIVAFTVINKLTSPLKLIAKKLKTTSLGNNQPMEWNANDEIGLMVKEYNRMLGNLEQNRIDLTRIQKETAWREIAQQVAHEIKNPLTPMKLTLQQLEQSIANQSIDKERAKKSVQMLLSQLEVLNGIATSFNSFATMPTPELKQVEVTSLLRNTVALFENESKGLVHLEIPPSSVIILGDEQLLGRIFSNIILNGIQSPSVRRVKIFISMLLDQDWCTLKFQDNGSGITAELRHKIFLPHFTTKQSGSGLGLAIAKQGIEQMGGSIWFETEEHKGATFYIKLRNA